MSPLGGLMKVLLGGLLGWAFVSGALASFTDKVTASVTGQTSASAGSSSGGAGGGGGF